MCAAALIGLSITPGAFAQSDVHPEIGSTVPRDLISSDVLALPEKERQAWVHGAVALATQVTSSYNLEQAQCMVDWYFHRGRGKESVLLALQTYPDSPASSVVIAVMRNVCAGD